MKIHGHLEDAAAQESGNGEARPAGPLQVVP
jgi:hypothetical protein